jgi:hypothetical protein
MKDFPLRSAIRQGCPLLPLPFSIVLEIPVRAIRQEEKQKAFKLERKKLNCHCMQMMSVHVENPNYFTKKLLELMSLVKLQDTKPTHKNQWHFYTLLVNCLKKKLRKQLHI